MSSAVNYQDVITQLDQAGLDVSGFEVGGVRPVRCFVDGERGRKGWYWLHEMMFESGDLHIVGAYGVWHGNDSGSQKIEIPKTAGATRADNAEVRKRMMASKRRLAAQLKAEQAKAAKVAIKKWRALSEDGVSGYLEKKDIGSLGVRFTGDGAIAVPMRDTSGKLHGLQFILDRSNPSHKEAIRRADGDKRFWPTGLAMQGHFHMLGVPDPKGIMLITEGYATGASLYAATGAMPVAVVFSANNVIPVLLNLEKHYPRMRFLICGDDDFLCRCGADVEGEVDARGRAKKCRHQTLVSDNPDAAPGKRSIIPCSHCGLPHKKINTGVKVAMAASMTVDRAEWIVPEFTDRTDPKSGKPVKLTDFNDLHVEESLQAVAAQLNAAIELKFPDRGEAEPPAREPRNGGAGDGLPSFISIDDACERFSLIWRVKDTMFDHHLRDLVPKSCVMDVIPDHGWREWKVRADRMVYDIDSVGFDPSGSDPKIRCNLWGGWPTEPDSRGSCDKLLELLEYMCSGEDRPRDVYQWLLKWLAYPIQHPGAKMKTALVVHGGQGVGKNLFFEAVMAVYGDYGRVVGQAELEDRFNDWVSKRLFLIANEVIARQELFHQKNKIKALITDDWIRINPKNVAAHDERNHLNLVFLSNEAQPVVLDADDRRFMAIWTPAKRKPEFYREVLNEIRNGGIAALHDRLLHVDLKGFDPGAPPLETRARKQLIEISKESPDRFVEMWLRGEMDIEISVCALADLYRIYVEWCRREGERFSYAKNKFSSHIGMRDDIDIARKPVLQGNGKPKPVVVVLPSADEKPAEDTWQKWLAPRVKAFHDAMDEF